MGRIFCIVGKSSSGKDTIYKKIIENSAPRLVPVVLYTTRPMRTGEKNGADYNFVTKADLAKFEANNEIIEKRSYKTTKGVWFYFTVKFELKSNTDYILITTLEGAESIIGFYGESAVHLVYLTIDDKLRLTRCIEREAKQQKPDYREVCRRFLADDADFSEEKLKKFKNIHYINTSLNPDECLLQWQKIYKEVSE